MKNIHSVMVLSVLIFGCKARNFNASNSEVATWQEKAGNGKWVKESENPNLFNLYKQNLQTTENISWFVVKLPPSYELPQGEPVPSFYNDHIVWAMNADKQPVVGFRPINTTTGCTTGCTPVVFHLKTKTNGRVIEIIEEKDTPLRKINHGVFSSDDKAKILGIAKELPDVLNTIGDPKLTTENLTKFPPQTWTTLKPYLVEGGAYTSIRIYEAALKTAHYAQRTLQTDATLLKWMAYAGSLLSDVTTPAVAAQRVATIVSLLSDVNTPFEGKQYLLSKTSKIILSAISNDTTIGSANVARSYFAQSFFKNTHKTAYCDFYIELLNSQKGQELILKIDKEKSKWPTCEEVVHKSSPLLAAALLNNSAEVKVRATGVNFKEVPPFIKKNARTLEAFALAAKISGDTTSYSNIMALLKVEFPDYKPGQPSPAPATGVQSQYEIEYRANLRRGFLTTASKLPAITTVKNGASFNIPANGKQLYVFFASWCPHCQSTIKSWVEKGFSTSLWNKIQLVEVYQKGKNETAAFCSTTGLSSIGICSAITKAPEGTAAANAFFQQMAMSGVPRIVVTNSSGIVRLFEYRIDDSAGRNLERDLTWLLEEANK